MSEAKNALNMRQKLLFLVIAFLSFSLISSCSADVREPIKYRKLAFKAELSTGGLPTDFSAILTVEAANGEGGRDYLMEFTAPESLVGLSVETVGERTVIRFGEKEFTSVDAVGAEALSPSAIVKMLTDESEILSEKKFLGENGEELWKLETESHTLFLDGQNRLPTKIADKKSGFFITVHSFSYTER